MILKMFNYLIVFFGFVLLLFVCFFWFCNYMLLYSNDIEI